MNPIFQNQNEIQYDAVEHLNHILSNGGKDRESSFSWNNFRDVKI